MKRKGLIEKLTKTLIVKSMRKSYVGATQASSVKFIMDTVFEELQKSFREDNSPTTVAFMVEQILDGDHLPEDGGMYKELSKAVGVDQ